MTKCSGAGCELDITNKGIGCDYCKNWYCPKCSDCPTTIFKAIESANKSKLDVSMIFYICKVCRPFTSVITKVGKDISELKDSIVSLKKDIETSGTEIKLHVDNKSAEVVTDVKSEVNQQKESFSDIVKRDIKIDAKQLTGIELTDVKKVVTETSLEVKEQEIRDRSFIVYHKEESKENNSKLAAEDDLSFIKTFVKDGLAISEVCIEQCFRIGHYDIVKQKSVPNKQWCRPLKVVLKNRSQRDKVISNLSNLKQCTNDKLRKVIITIDKNQQQRDETRKLYEEAQNRNKDLTDTKWVIRGSAYKPVLKEIQINKRD